MAELDPVNPLAALLPLEVGEHRIEALPQSRVTALSPFVTKGLPAPDRAEARPGGLLLWAGRGLWLAVGTPPADLAPGTPTVDETDTWAVLRLVGPAPDAVLARLVPIDLRPLHFAPGHVAKSLVGHVAALIHRPAVAPEALEIWLPRSVAAHALHEIAAAARALAAR